MQLEQNASSHAEEGLPFRDREKAKRPTDCFLAFCRLLNVITGICAALCLVSHAMAMAVYSPVTDSAALVEQALRLYGMVLAIIIILVETEWQTFLTQAQFAESWVGRSALQLLEALLTFEMATAEGKSCHETGSCDFHKSLEVYRVVSALALLGCASIYFIGGILCFGRIRKARFQKANQRLQVQSDLQELERKREELEGMLTRL